jgi:hypothetical protein
MNLKCLLVGFKLKYFNYKLLDFYFQTLSLKHNNFSLYCSSVCIELWCIFVAVLKERINFYSIFNTIELFVISNQIYDK